ncbi:flagellar filament capping protein FliD [Actomonas aquatica]|uniref:Flagellar hook-associated protein 2 n=1 Tax=Actomonas aquatica TaxID=2866162 RepID=A0ABZ1CGD2_9BACT|nr:flagellar filament capping protein FliD [Opitutus sp. WL0086]WRQ89325.1 flagellar filament capping protein FliD [Opitutus sp. WL0086]
MAGLQLAGLASGFDWKSLVDSLMSLERVPIQRLETEQVTNIRRNNALTELGTRLKALKTANNALNDSDLFNARSASSSTSDSTWDPAVIAGATTGTHTFNVTRLATAASQRGAADVADGIAASTDVSGVTLAAMPTATAVSAGTFTVNGAQVTIATTDSLQDVFDAISTATGGDVTAAYDNVTDTITLSSASEIVLGAANDTSNFLTVAKLANNGTGTVTSSNGLGTVDTDAALVDARLKSAITAVDGSGNGSFSLNGVAIDYNVNDDSITDIIARINASDAGVTAAYDSAADRMTLTNDRTGDIGLGLSESAGGLLGALGLTAAAGGSLQRGVNAEFTIDGGSTITSTSNTLTADVHGVTGLDLTVDSTGSQDISVKANTTEMKNAINEFITRFNAVQSYIDDATRITTSSSGVSTSTLSSNREIQDWARQLRGYAFSEISGVSGSITRLEKLGIDFTSSTSSLSISDASKLDDALNNNAEDVAAFFTTADTGFFARFDTLLDNYVGDDGNGGYLEDQQTALTDANKSIDQQIEDAERRLEQRRAVLEAGFIAMEQAQQQLQTMAQQISSIPSIAPTTSSKS